MTEENLSQKLFMQKDGKKFAYAKDIKEKIKELKEDLNKRIKYFSKPKTGFGDAIVYFLNDLKGEIDKIFGKELTK